MILRMFHSGLSNSRENGNFRANLICHKLIKISRDSGVILDFNKLVPFLFPEGVPLDEIVNLELLNPIQRSRWPSNDFQDPEALEFWLIQRFEADTEPRSTIRA